MSVQYFKAKPAPTAEQTTEIARLEQEAADCRRREEESFQRSDTDGFLSQWASGITANLNTRKADLLRDGGCAQFPVLCDAEGNVIAIKVYEFADQFAPEWSSRVVRRWRLPDELAAKLGRKWVPVAGHSGKSRVQKQLGLHEEQYWFPAYAKITTGGRKSTGLAGCANAYVGVFKKED